MLMWLWLLAEVIIVSDVDATVAMVAIITLSYVDAMVAMVTIVTY